MMSNSFTKVKLYTQVVRFKKFSNIFSNLISSIKLIKTILFILKESLKFLTKYSYVIKKKTLNEYIKKKIKHNKNKLDHILT